MPFLPLMVHSDVGSHWSRTKEKKRAFWEPDNVLMQAPAVVEKRAIAPFLI